MNSVQPNARKIESREGDMARNIGKSIAGAGSTLALMFGVAVPLFAAVPTGASSQLIAKTVPLKSLLLNGERIPTGWTQETAPTSSGNGCPNPKGVRVVQDASAFFVSGQDRQVVERLQDYSPADERSYASLVSSLNDCIHEESPGSDKKSAGTALHRLSLPQFGSQSSAFNLTWTENGKAFNIYEVVIQSGNIAVTLTELSAGSPGVAQLEKFARLALARLPSGGAPSIDTTTTT
jgi:hypothetical protein